MKKKRQTTHISSGLCDHNSSIVPNIQKKTLVDVAAEVLLRIQTNNTTEIH